MSSFVKVKIWTTRSLIFRLCVVTSGQEGPLRGLEGDQEANGGLNKWDSAKASRFPLPPAVTTSLP